MTTSDPSEATATVTASATAAFTAASADLTKERRLVVDLEGRLNAAVDNGDTASILTLRGKRHAALMRLAKAEEAAIVAEIVSEKEAAEADHQAAQRLFPVAVEARQAAAAAAAKAREIELRLGVHQNARIEHITRARQLGNDLERLKEQHAKERRELGRQLAGIDANHNDAVGDITDLTPRTDYADLRMQG